MGTAKEKQSPQMGILSGEKICLQPQTRDGDTYLLLSVRQGDGDAFPFRSGDSWFRPSVRHLYPICCEPKKEICKMVQTHCIATAKQLHHHCKTLAVPLQNSCSVTATGLQRNCNGRAASLNVLLSLPVETQKKPLPQNRQERSGFFVVCLLLFSHFRSLSKFHFFLPVSNSF